MHALNTLVIGGHTLNVDSVELLLDLGDENFSFVLTPAGGGPIQLFGYCRPVLERRSDIVSRVLELAVEDEADYVALPGTDRVLAPFADPESPARLVVEALREGRVVLSYRGPFLSIDPSGTTDDEPIDVDLRVDAAWPA